MISDATATLRIGDVATLAWYDDDAGATTGIMAVHGVVRQDERVPTHERVDAMGFRAEDVCDRHRDDADFAVVEAESDAMERKLSNVAEAYGFEVVIG